MVRKGLSKKATFQQERKEVKKKKVRYPGIEYSRKEIEGLQDWSTVIMLREKQGVHWNAWTGQEVKSR